MVTTKYKGNEQEGWDERKILYNYFSEKGHL